MRGRLSTFTPQAGGPTTTERKWTAHERWRNARLKTASNTAATDWAQFSSGRQATGDTLRTHVHAMDTRIQSIPSLSRRQRKTDTDRGTPKAVPRLWRQHIRREKGTKERF